MLQNIIPIVCTHYIAISDGPRNVWSNLNSQIFIFQWLNKSECHFYRNIFELVKSVPRSFYVKKVVR